MPLQMKKKDWALWLAARGFRVFPCVEGTKTPVSDPMRTVKRQDDEEAKANAPQWRECATTDPDRIEQMWQGRAFNVAIAAGEWDGPGTLVITDADVKDGAKGLENLEVMYEMMDLPHGMRVRTTSGGEHHYSWTLDPEGITISANAIPEWEGLDVRGPGGYVMAPGSSVNGRTYEILGVEDEDWRPEIPQAPDWLTRLWRSAQGSRPRGGQTDGQAIVELDTPAAVRDAREWLRDSAPEAVPGSRDHTLYRIACILREFGLSQAVAAEIFVEEYADRGKLLGDQVDDSVYRQKVANAYEHAKGVWGGKSADAEFDDASSAAETFRETESLTAAGLEAMPDRALVRGVKGKPRALFLVPFEQSATLGPIISHKPLIKGVVNQESMVVLYGDSNAGKTFVALSMGYAIGADRDWLGHRVRQDGLVVHVSAEGGASIHARLAALRQVHPEGREDGTEVGLSVVPCPVDLFDAKADLVPLTKLIQDAETQWGRKCVMVVLDTLARTMAGGDENSAMDMGTYVANVDRLRTTLKACTMIIHHSGKDATKGARGSGALRAATDTEIEVVKGVIRDRKQRDMSQFADIGFALEGVEIGVDEDGDPITSAVVRQTELTPSESADEELGDVTIASGMGAEEDFMLAILRDAGEEGLDKFEWEKRYFYDRTKRLGTKKGQINARNMRDRRRTIIAEGYVRTTENRMFYKDPD